LKIAHVVVAAGVLYIETEHPVDHTGVDERTVGWDLDHHLGTELQGRLAVTIEEVGGMAADAGDRKLPAERARTGSSAASQLVGTASSNGVAAARTRSIIRARSGAPATGSRTFPGSRVEPIRAWRTTRMRLLRAARGRRRRCF
jgi:hypothetical protein